MKSWESTAVTSPFITGLHKADLQPISTASADQLAVNEKVICVNGDDYWLYDAVDPEISKILQFRLFPTATK